ncbi:MAG: hypothetical protein WCK77_13485 [Verrucomicrobiota bacterium]
MSKAANKSPEGSLPSDDEPTALLAKLEKARFDAHSPPEKPITVLSLDGVQICTLGNISNIQGPAKSAKSTVLGAMMAAVLKAMLEDEKGTRDWTETLRFSSDAPKLKNGRVSVILHFDTEQSPYDHHGQVLRMLARAGGDGTDETVKQRLYSYSLVEFGITERVEAIKAIIEELRETKYVLCIFVDGVADIVSDPNDGRESFEMVADLHRMAANKKHPCAIITVLHENPSRGKDDGGKTRGHLGSHIERKSECNLRVGKDNGTETSTIWVERARRAHIPRSEGVKIQWFTDPDPPHSHSRFVLAPTATTEGVTNTKRTNNTKAKAKSVDTPKLIETSGETPLDRDRIFLNTVLERPLSYKELSEKTKKHFRIKIDGAKARVGQWKKKGWIFKGGGKRGLYGLYPHREEAPAGEVPAVDGTITPAVAAESGPDAGVPSTPEVEVVPQAEPGPSSR